jgi:predicted nuclease of predicted toxin-antitoxin system
MASAKRTSRKPSASSSVAPPEQAGRPPPLFIDRCAWSRKLVEALAAADIPHIAHRDKFADDCPDEEWLAIAGREGWVVLTRDQAIRRKPNELKAFREARLIVFVLASGNASAETTARLVVELYPKILRRVRGAKPPAMFSVTLAGGIYSVR